jgi:uncharacterized damage-inducible protein DinB
MAIIETFLPEYDHEMETARKLLERLPDEHLGWKPHEKSMTLGRLATHIAELPGWASSIIESNEFNVDPGGRAPQALESRATVLDLFDRNCAAARTKIAVKSDAELMSPWSFKSNGQLLFTVPKVFVLRTWLLSHVIHHRGQLSVYLRLQDVPLPSIYGPSADSAS